MASKEIMWHDWPLPDSPRPKLVDSVAKDGSEKAKFWRAPDLENLELLRATYINHRFTPHSHETFVVGVIESGAETFKYRGESHIAPANSLVIINPDETHDGHAGTGTGWSYRTFYPDVSLMQRAATELAGRNQPIPYFPAAIYHDPAMAALVRHLHITLEESVSRLERESRFLWTFGQLITRYAGKRPMIPRIGQEYRPVARVRDYIEAHYAEDVSLDQLAHIANLSPFHLLRVFHAEVGLPPHAYATQVRVRQARRLLAAGLSIADAAAATGMVDQSHLTRHFKRIVGVTPGLYRQNRKNIQDLSA